MDEPALVQRLWDQIWFWRPVDRRRLAAAMHVPVIDDRPPPEPACRSAGWYIDINAPGYLRWWDGDAWRPHWTPT